MNAQLPYTATPRQSGIQDLLDMVERGCRRLMLTGGGSFGTDIQRDKAIPLSPNEKRCIANMLAQGHGLHDIAESVGRHYTTVARHTRHLRSRGRGRPAKEAS